MNHLKFSAFNPRSLRNKTTQVLELFIKEDIDICCLSETWLRKGDTAISNEFVERGYTLYQNPREGRGGGTAIAFKSELKLSYQKTPTFTSFEVTEAVCRINGKMIRISSVYRSVSKSSLDVFLEEFRSLSAVVDGKA